MIPGLPSFPEPLSRTIQDAFWQWAQSNYGLHGTWQTLWLNGLPLGRLNPQWQAQIRKDWHAGMKTSSDGLHLYSDSWLSLGDGLQHMAYGWKELGLLQGWREERFDVCGQDGALFALERAAFRPLGLMSKAVHLNGLTFKDGCWRFWVGRRSPGKAVDPDKLDNLVGGGVSCGEHVGETILRESEEEAGLLPSDLHLLTRAAKIHSLRPVSRGLHNEMLYIFDTVLPEEVLPENQDGEVAGFELMDVGRLVEAMSAGLMMSDAQLVFLDAFGRYGLLDTQHPLAQWLQSLRNADG